MSALLVGDRHHQRRDDVERRDRDDQGQDDEHHPLLDLRPRGRSCAWLRVQSLTKMSPPRRAGSSRADRAAPRRDRASLSRTPDTRSLEPVQPLGVREVHQRERRVVLVLPDLEDPDDGELLQARHDAGGRDLSSAARSASTFRRAARRSARASSAPSTMRELAGLQRFQPPGVHVPRRCRPPRLALRVDAAHDGAAHLVVEREHPLRLRRRAPPPTTCGFVARLVATRSQSASELPGAGDLHVRRDAEDARRAVPSGSRSSPTARRSARRRRARCRASR